MLLINFVFIFIQLVGHSLAFKCPSSFGMYLDPERCTHYYECEGFSPVSKQCGNGLFFNADAKVCDWPSNVDQSKCSRSTNANINSNSNVKPNGNSNSNVASLHHLSFRCYADGLYEDPVSCKHFIECNAGSPYRKICPKGLHFDIRIKGCNWPESMACQKGHNRPFTTQRPPIATDRPQPQPQPSQPPKPPQPSQPPNTEQPPFSSRPTSSWYDPDRSTEPTDYATPPHDSDRDTMNFKPNGQPPPNRGGITAKPITTTSQPSSNCEWCFRCPRKDGYYENKYDPYTYYHCYKGEAFLLYCPQDSVWLQKKEICQQETSPGKEGDKINEAFKDDTNGSSPFEDGAGLIDVRMKTKKTTPNPNTNNKPKVTTSKPTTKKR